MIDAAGDVIRDYHRRTKHALTRYARGPQGLDWPNQPDPFRTFRGASRHAFGLGADGLEASFAALSRPGELAPSPLDEAAVGVLFEVSLGLAAWKSYGGARWALRCNPSSGNLHPTEGYLLCPDLPGLGRGVYHYAPGDHALERRAEPEPGTGRWNGAFPGGGVLVGLSSIHWREAWKYGERAYRYCQHDVGHALAAVRYAAAALGWRATLLEHGATRTSPPSRAGSRGGLRGRGTGASRPGPLGRALGAEPPVQRRFWRPPHPPMGGEGKPVEPQVSGGRPSKRPSPRPASRGRPGGWRFRSAFSRPSDRFQRASRRRTCSARGGAPRRSTVRRPCRRGLLRDARRVPAPPGARPRWTPCRGRRASTSSSSSTAWRAWSRGSISWPAPGRARRRCGSTWERGGPGARVQGCPPHLGCASSWPRICPRRSRSSAATRTSPPTRPSRSGMIARVRRSPRRGTVGLPPAVLGSGRARAGPLPRERGLGVPWNRHRLLLRRRGPPPPRLPRRDLPVPLPLHRRHAPRRPPPHHPAALCAPGSMRCERHIRVRLDAARIRLDP